MLVPSRIIGGKKTYIRLIRPFLKKKQYHHDYNNDINKNVICALKKIDKSCYNASLNYRNDNFNKMKIEDKSEEKNISEQ